MFELTVAIISSALVLVLFKLFPRFHINTFQAIVFNYFTAFTCGVLLFSSEWDSKAIGTGDWPFFAVVVGFLLISLFNMIGKSTQNNGVALTSVAVKMSMAVALIFMIILYDESVNELKIAGIVMAFIGVILVSYTKPSSTKGKYSWMLVILFLGSGLLDVILNYVQKYELNYLTPSLFSAISFGFAGLLGIMLLGYRVFRGTEKIQLKNIFAGIALGIPNYFSIYLLLEAYTSTGWNDSMVLAILNVCIVLLSAIIGFIAFREKATKLKLLGLFSAITAILLLLISAKN
jgi:drug/metabolite transporter (DMT)-like permease